MRAILFDLDSTLVNREDTIRRYINCFLVQFAARLKVPEQRSVLHAVRAADNSGLTPSDRFAMLHSKLEWKHKTTVTELSAHWRRHFPGQAAIMTGACETLSELLRRGYLLGLVTNGSVQGQLAKLRKLKLTKYFCSIQISEQAGIEKPHPDIFNKALRELHVSPDEACHVGAHPENDIIGAQNAGLIAVWFRGARSGRSWPTEHPEPTHQLRSLNELPALLDKNWGLRDRIKPVEVGVE